MCLVLVRVLETGGKWPTASPLHPNPSQYVGISDVHIFQKDCFLETHWEWMIY